MAVQVPADYPGCPVTVLEAEASGRVLVPPRWGLWDAAIAIGGYLLLSLVVGVPLVLLDAPLPVLVLVGGTVPWLALAGWPLLVTRLRGNGPRIDLGLRLTWSDAGWGALAGVAGLILGSIVAAITVQVFGEFTSAAGEAAAEMTSSGRGVLLLFAIMVAVGAPFAEEIAFRGLLFAGLRKRGLGGVPTVLVTAAAFALLHAEPVRIGVLLAVGLAAGFVRLKTGSVGAAMVAHGVNNAIPAVYILLGMPEVSP